MKERLKMKIAWVFFSLGIIGILGYLAGVRITVGKVRRILFDRSIDIQTRADKLSEVFGFVKKEGGNK